MYSVPIQNYLHTFYWILDTMICQMTSAKLSNNISHNFIVQMIPHHQAAIQMSHNILIYSTDDRLKAIAQDIIKTQTESIHNMKKILHRCSCPNQSCSQLNDYQNQLQKIFATMFYRMNHAYTTNQVNDNFMREMIPHHQGAIAMAKTTLHYPICPELKPILEAIITSQEKGVCQMEELLKENNPCF